MKRSAWTGLAVFLLVFAVFEAVKHRGWAIPLAFAGMVLPEVGRFPGGRVLDHPLPPLVLLVAVGVLADTNDQAAPLFTLGLTWLARIALDRAAGGRTFGGWTYRSVSTSRSERSTSSGRRAPSRG